MANVLQIPHIISSFSKYSAKKNPADVTPWANFLINSNIFLYGLSNRQYSTYNGLCYSSCGGLPGTRHSSGRINPMTHRTESERSKTDYIPLPIALKILIGICL